MKKVVKFLGKLFLGFIALLLVAIFIFLIKNQIFIGGVNDATIAYLDRNKKSIDRATIAQHPEIALFDSEFYASQVFLLGETHGYADVQQIDQYMIRHLNQKWGVRFYLAEIDTSRANALNTFLRKETKDTALLKQVVRDIATRIPQLSSQELYDKWISLYDYNNGLSDSLKITVIGVDQDFNDTTTTISRDSSMLVNFKRTVEEKGLQKEKFYGFFGYSHVLQTGYNQGNIYSFAARLKRAQLPYASHLQSIVCFTLDSEMRMPKVGTFPTPPDEKIGGFNGDGPLITVKGIKELKKVTEEGSITLFDLKGEGSPYKNSQHLCSIHVTLVGADMLPNNESQKTTDFFQYAILLRNSRALSKLK